MYRYICFTLTCSPFMDYSKGVNKEELNNKTDVTVPETLINNLYILYIMLISKVHAESK